MAKTKLEKIADIELQMSQLENQKKQLLQQYKEQERKDRTKRLCKRAGLLESMLPDTITLTDDLFKSFLEKTILSESASKLLSALTVQNTAAAATKPAEVVRDRDADECGDGCSIWRSTIITDSTGQFTKNIANLTRRSAMLFMISTPTKSSLTKPPHSILKR